MSLGFVEFSQNYIAVKRLNQNNQCTGESWCSGFRPFHYHFNTTVWSFREWFRRIGMRQRGWRVGFAHSSAIAQIIPSSEKHCLSWSEVDCFRALLNVIRLQLSNVTYPAKNIYIWLRMHFQAFYAFWAYFVFLLQVFCKFLESNSRFTVKVFSGVLTDLSVLVTDIDIAL